MSMVKATKRLRLVLVALICAFALVLAGCAAKEEQSQPAQDSPQATEDATGVVAPSTTGKLQVIGAQLSSQAGDPVQLRGVSTHGLSWFPQYVNQEFFTELREDWGVNVVRLAMYTAEYGGYCTGGDKAALEQLVIDGVNYAQNADLYAVVDWHILSDADPNIHITEAKQFFEKISAEFADKDNVIYEICNEPNGATTWGQITAYAETIIPIIRANDPDAVIIVGTPTWSQRIDEAALDPLPFENIMYTLHFYAAEHKQDLRERLEATVKAGVPVFVTEFGITEASGDGKIDYDSAAAWIKLMDELDVSYICWNLSNKDEASAMFLDTCDKTSGFTSDDLSDEGKWLVDTLDSPGI
ncbi:glycoside hydrolase family 5 protein [Anaerotardibacter muris]|uniref:glycoside hydrolase family 5 protein n=1 Tax=Anaerotardibacter muris TaxID=2941505 RepID=UPI00203DFD1A|nr:glycoside hydrolase family 5 protein [Anaerotardibacter muris]